MQPLIGITCSFDDRDGRFFLARAYIDSVAEAGGIPLILPGTDKIKKLDSYLKVISGVLLAGGGDLDPSYFDEEPHPALGEITPERDRFEIMLANAAMEKKMPILGICRGIQVLNVACGGNLIQHIPAEIKKPLKHSQSAPRAHPTHNITIDKDSQLADIFGVSALRVNSFHHQSVKEPAEGFRVSAMSSDGVIEALEALEYPFVIGVQWHPECMTVNDSKSRQLFKAFVEATRKPTGKRNKKDCLE